MDSNNLLLLLPYPPVDTGLISSGCWWAANPVTFAISYLGRMVEYIPNIRQCEVFTKDGCYGLDVSPCSN